jgi:hypothetical protein
LAKAISDWVVAAGHGVVKKDFPFPALFFLFACLFSVRIYGEVPAKSFIAGIKGFIIVLILFRATTIS